MEEAVRKVKGFKANMGGTEILKPLKAALEYNADNHHKDYKKIIFVLTDGITIEAKHCLDTLKEHRSSLTDTTLHTFGIGTDSDESWVEQAAKLGNGICTLLRNDVD